MSKEELNEGVDHLAIYFGLDGVTSFWKFRHIFFRPGFGYEAELSIFNEFEHIHAIDEVVVVRRRDESQALSNDLIVVDDVFEVFVGLKSSFPSSGDFLC